MAMLTAGSKSAARRLLHWDVARVVALAAAGHDVSLYQARQRAAETAIDADVASWSEEVRSLFLAVLEVTRTPTPVVQLGIGRLQHPIQRMTRDEQIASRELAREIGVLGKLQEVAPVHWAEGD